MMMMMLMVVMMMMMKMMMMRRMMMMILGACVDLVDLGTRLTRQISRLVATTCQLKRGPWSFWPRNLSRAGLQTTRSCRLGTLWS
eukprot:3852284-Pyramimonas_sp.AAC.1